MNKLTFLSLFGRLIDYLIFEIESQDINQDLDFDSNDESLSIESEIGNFVINRQVALFEVWLSSPITGAKHFQYKEGRFLNFEDQDLLQILQNDLAISFSNDRFESFLKEKYGN